MAEARTIAKIPWPGPRPISPSDDADRGDELSALVGRGREMSELRQVCRSFAVVELTAPSGAGKTSFLAGAKVYLEERGSKVVQARHWMDALGEYEKLDEKLVAENDPVPLYCLALGLDLPLDAGVPELRTAIRDLDSERRVICFFDQFEELLRFERDLGSRLLDLIAQIAAATPVTHVVVARTEFRDQLRPLELREATTWHMLLSELSDDDVIREVVTGPVPDGVELDEKIPARIVEWWKEARSRSSKVGPCDAPYPAVTEFGLLHLQALLLDFRERAVERLGQEARELRVEDLEEYARWRSAGDSATDDGGALMAEAMHAYIEKSVAGCECESWPVGPRLMLARAVGQLSSAGYKVAQPVSILVARAIQAELGSPRSALESQTRFRLDEPGGREEAANAFVKAFQVEPAGPGRASADESQVAEEMVSVLEGVLRHLSEAPNVLRRYPHGGDSIYELVHDGVSGALDHWAEEVLEDPIALLGGICVRRGEIFDHDLSAKTFLDERDEVRPYLVGVKPRRIGKRTVAAVEGIGWRGLGVHRLGKESEQGRLSPVRIEDVAFVDCNFTGTLFKDVVFSNVRFEGCEMRGVAMIGCVFEDVAFDRSRLAGAAINGGAFGAVDFDCSGQNGAMNYVSVETAEPGAEVRIRNLEDAAGIFLVGLRGGSWSLEDVDLTYLAFQSEDAGNLTLRFGAGCRLAHAHLDVPAGSVVLEEGAKIENLTGSPSIMEADALGKGAATPG